MRHFAFDAAKDFGEVVADHPGAPPSPHEEREFVDGGRKACLLDSLWGRDLVEDIELRYCSMNSIDW